MPSKRCRQVSPHCEYSPLLLQGGTKGGLHHRAVRCPHLTEEDVPEAGFEPAHPNGRRSLKPVRLPIPPLRHRLNQGVSSVVPT